MTSVQVFAFLILPVAVAIAGWAVALIANPPKALSHARFRRQADVADQRRHRA